MKRADAIESGRLALTDDATDLLADQILLLSLTSAPVRHHRFHRERRWTFDFAWPLLQIAVEVESCTAGVKNAAQYRNHLEKFNTAALLGYRVFRFSPHDVRQGRAIAFLCEALAPNRNQETQADGIDAGTDSPARTPL